MLSTDGTTVAMMYDALDRMIEQTRGSAHTEIVYGPYGMKLALMNGQTMVISVRRVDKLCDMQSPLHQASHSWTPRGLTYSLILSRKLAETLPRATMRNGTARLWFVKTILTGLRSCLG